jgi:small-conductance mechanosensitive channel/ABC-type branched-subunit amino acid transport system substrate-binding protein
MPIAKLIDLIHTNRKWRLFALILLGIAVVGTVLSMIARVAFLKDDPATRPLLAVVAPNTAQGVAVQQGAALYLERLNASGGFLGRPVELLLIEEKEDAADKVLADKRIVAVVGHLSPETLTVASARYHQAGLPVITPAVVDETIRATGVISLGQDPGEEARFVANYARNIQQQRMMYVVREEGIAFDALVEPFADVYKRFETPIRQSWTLPANADEAQVSTVLQALARIDIGGVYIATRPELAARLVKGIRSAGNALDVFGPSALASGAFMGSLRTQSGADAEIHAHGLVVATPVLFDTANDEAQRFQTRFQQKFAASPDWLATLAHDAARLAMDQARDKSKQKPADAAQNRSLTIADLQTTPRALLGELAVHQGRVALPVQVGLYNGDRLISAPVQLLPIAKGANFNYIDALRQGRVLYVNDRFMFKTNVVYVGATVNEISNIDRQKETATLDLSIWFRYRGKFDPHDLQIVNAIEPVKFDKPEEVKEGPEVQYRRYRIRQSFALNFTGDKRTYNQNIAGLQFRHRLLNRNNLSYVVDVLGMPSGNALLEDMQQRRVVKAGSDWKIANAWISQELLRERGHGAPQYVGMTGEQASFSTVTLGILLRPESLSARDLIPADFFVYLAIFGILGALVAVGMDHRKSARYWAAQSWLLRLIFWPMLLLAIGNLAIDSAFSTLAPVTTKSVVTLYESLWWLLAARLADLALRRFVWDPLEASAGRKVPNVVKVLGTVAIFVIGIGGIIAVVLGQTLTSLLATSGVLITIVGFAIQANIANIFSGIVLNVERPFQVGDFIKINNVIGQVTDITWRTTRVESNDGPMVSLANSKVAEAFMENYSVVPHGMIAETMFYAPADQDPDPVIKILNDAIAANKAIICKDDPIYEPMARFKGIVNVSGQWVTAFSAGYRVKILPKKSKAREDLWKFVRQRFIDEGIPLVPANSAEHTVLISAEKSQTTG